MCKLSEAEQEKALERFFEIYEEYAGKLTWSKKNFITSKSFENIEDFNNALYDNVKNDNMGTSGAFAIFLKKELEKIGLPARFGWIDSLGDCDEIGHGFVIYKYLDKNYCADLCSAVKSDEEYERGEQKFLVKEPFAEYIASYLTVGIPTIQYGDYSFELNMFKEYDEIYDVITQVRKGGHSFNFKRMPFITNELIQANNGRKFQLNLDWRPFDFDEVAIKRPNLDVQRAGKDLPAEILAAIKRGI